MSPPAWFGQVGRIRLPLSVTSIGLTDFGEAMRSQGRSVGRSVDSSASKKHMQG